jgi:hypothetical protein
VSTLGGSLSLWISSDADARYGSSWVHEVGWVSRHRAPLGVRRAVLVIASVAGLTGLLGVGQTMLSTERAPATAVDHPAAGVVSSAAWSGTLDRHWSRVLRRLDARRSHAFAQADPGPLHKVYLPGSGLWSRDAQVIATFAHRGLRIVGLRMTILALRVDDRTGPTAVLSVVDRISRARAVNSAGRSRQLPRDRATAHRLMLRRVPTGWRIAAISNRLPERRLVGGHS